MRTNCEAEAGARTACCHGLAHDVAMQVAAMAPTYVSSEDIPEGEEAVPQEAVLMQQPFIKDPSKTIRDLVNESIGKLGENIQVRRFTRLALGE